MNAVSPDKKIKQYLPLLENEEKQTILSVIKSFIKLKEMPPQRISIVEYNKELEEADMNAVNFLGKLSE